MNEKVKKSIRDVIVLVLIATISGLLLGLFNHITYVDPKLEAMNGFNQLYQTQEGFSLIAEPQDGKIRYVAKSGSVVAVLSLGKGGYKGTVQTYVFFENNKIVKIAVGENGETFISKLEDADYLEQFYGWESGTEDISVDMVTGATKSSTAVKNAVFSAMQYYTAHFEGGQYLG